MDSATKETFPLANSPQADGECIVCIDQRGNIVLCPCKHMKICSEFHLKLQAEAIASELEEYKCPVCRACVQDSMQIFV